MVWLFAALVLCFGLVVFFGAPYLPTLKRQQQAAFKLLKLNPGQTLLELGCGDGRVLRAAARQGIKAVGYELNPILFAVSVIVTWRYRKLVTVKFGNYWAMDWPPTDGIYAFILTKYMNKLDKKVTQTYRGKKVKVVSYAFEIPQRKASKTEAGLFLYIYE